MITKFESRDKPVKTGSPPAQTNSRWWEARDSAGERVCLTVYRRGAREVVRRLSLAMA